MKTSKIIILIISVLLLVLTVGCTKRPDSGESTTIMKDQLDTMLHGPEGTSLDTAQAIGERLLQHDFIKANLKWQLDVLETLVNTAWLKNDTTQWLKRSCQYVDICHQLGKEQETNALRMEEHALHDLAEYGSQYRGFRLHKY